MDKARARGRPPPPAFRPWSPLPASARMPGVTGTMPKSTQRLPQAKRTTIMTPEAKVNTSLPRQRAETPPAVSGSQLHSHLPPGEQRPPRGKYSTLSHGQVTWRLRVFMIYEV